MPRSYVYKHAVPLSLNGVDAAAENEKVSWRAREALAYTVQPRPACQLLAVELVVVYNDRLDETVEMTNGTLKFFFFLFTFHCRWKIGRLT